MADQLPNDLREELLEEAKKKVEAKKTLSTLAVVFAFSSAILMILSFFIPAAAFWLRLPILIMVLLLGFLYLMLLVIPFELFSKEREEEEIAKELKKLYKNKPSALPAAEDLSDEDRLELKELERLKEKWER